MEYIFPHCSIIFVNNTIVLIKKCLKAAWRQIVHAISTGDSPTTGSTGEPGVDFGDFFEIAELNINLNVKLN